MDAGSISLARNLCTTPSVSNGPIQLLRRFRVRKPIAPYIWPTLFTALGGFVWGFDTGSIGPITVMPQFESEFGYISSTVRGLLVSSILITASLASVVAGPISERISRTYTIAIGGVVFAVGSAIACSALGLPQLFVGRCIAGIGEGLFASSVTVYVSEISPASRRGRLATTFQLFNTIGVTAGYFTCFGTARVPGSFSWRFPFGLAAAVAIVMAVGTPFLPHSPHWLLHVGRHAEAEAAAVKFGIGITEARKESRTSVVKANVLKDAKRLWAKDVRFRTILGLFLMGMQQASGIDAVLYYAPILFSQAGLSSTTAAFLASGVSGIVMVVLTVISQWFQDKWSRRSQMIGGGTIIGLSMIVIGAIYASGANEAKAGRYSVIALIYVFIAGFVSSWAVVCRIVVTEIQPKATRASATSLSQCMNWVVNWIIAFSTPLFLTKSSSGPYFLFGACSLLTVIVCLIFQPETKGLHLDTLETALDETPLQAKLKNYLGLRRRNPTSADELNIQLEVVE